MIEPIEHTGIKLNKNRNTPNLSDPDKRYGLDGRRDISKTSSKYVLEYKRIVFERYDRNGKLISRVPWTANKERAIYGAIVLQ